jgi:PhnB protein
MNPTAYRPPGWPSIIPRLFALDVEGQVAFLTEVFGADATVNRGGPTEVKLDGSVLMVSDGQGIREQDSSFLYVYVPDVDAVFQRARKAGGVVVEPPIDMPYGDRRATIRDPWGNHWQIATRLSTA